MWGGRCCVCGKFIYLNWIAKKKKQVNTNCVFVDPLRQRRRSSLASTLRSPSPHPFFSEQSTCTAHDSSRWLNPTPPPHAHTSLCYLSSLTLTEIHREVMAFVRCRWRRAGFAPTPRFARDQNLLAFLWLHVNHMLSWRHYDSVWI